MQLIDLTGKSFGRLTVLERVANKGAQPYWKCICSCGTLRNIAGGELRGRRTQSCGCQRIEMSRKANTRHGRKNTPEYRTYQLIRARCYYQKGRDFKNYGGRGITTTWKSFEEFFADMGTRPTLKHTIERIDNNGPYSKKNCRWATNAEQQNNKRTNHRLTFNNRTQTMMQWAQEYGISYNLFRGRIKNKWPIQRALTMPSKRLGKLNF